MEDNKKIIELASTLNVNSLKVAELREKLASLNQPTSGNKQELKDKLISTLLPASLTVNDLKAILKAQKLATTGNKEELMKRIKVYFSPEAPNSDKGDITKSAPSNVENPSSPIKSTSSKTDTAAKIVTKSAPNVVNPQVDEAVEVLKLNPHELVVPTLKIELAKRNLPVAGKKSELVDRLVAAILANLKVDEIKAGLKARDLPTTGKKEELLARLKGFMDGSVVPAIIVPEEKSENLLFDVNKATPEQLKNIPGIGEVLVERIVAGRPYKSLYHMGSAVSGIGKNRVKLIAPKLTGWTIDNEPQSASKIDFSSNDKNAIERMKNNEFILASWNVRNLSRNKTDERLDKILQLLLGFDFVAIQEVRDIDIIERIRSKIGNDWDAAISDQIGTEHHKERYAFLWRKKAIQVITPPELLIDISNSFVRPPFMGFFKAGSFDFIVITIHVIWGDSILGRRNEIKRLDEVLEKIQERALEEKDIILVGDFNMPPTDLAWEIDGWVPLIRPPATTVVGDTSLYDNIWLHGKHTFESEFKGQSGVVEFDKIIYEDSIMGRRLAISEISDHRPVWGLFSTHIDDDSQLSVSLKNLTI